MTRSERRRSRTRRAPWSLRGAIPIPSHWKYRPGGPGWEWIFLINVPIGVALVGLVVRFVPRHEPVGGGSADVLGAVTITSGLLGVVYAISKSVDHGWSSPATLGVLSAGLAMLGLFVVVERRVARPLVPLSMFRLRTLTAANVVAALVMGAFFGTAFQTTLFLQQVLGYSSLGTGAANLIGAASSVVVAAPIAARSSAVWVPPGRSCSVRDSPSLGALPGPSAC